MHGAENEKDLQFGDEAVKTSSKDANMDPDSAGGTSHGSGNLPAIVVFPFSQTELVENLIARGFSDAVSHDAAYILQRVGYSHMAPYFNAVESRTDEEPTVRAAHDLFLFDRMFQSVVFRYIGIFETQLRAIYSFHMGDRHGKHALYDEGLFLRGDIHRKAMENYRREIERSLKSKRARDEYQRNGMRLPIWDGVGFMTLGTLSKLYSNTADLEVTDRVSSCFGAKKDELSNWLRTITDARNACAHFDAYLARKQIPTVPKKIRGVDSDNHAPFYIVLLLMHLLRHEAPFGAYDYTKSLAAEIESLVIGWAGERRVPFAAMGLPLDWRYSMDELLKTEEAEE